MSDKIKWVCVFKSTSDFAARALAGNLEHAGLHPVLVDKRAQAFTIGNVEIHVPESEEAEALLLVEDQKEIDEEEHGA